MDTHLDTHPSIVARELVVIEPDIALGHVVALTLAHHGAPVRVFRSLAEAWEATREAPALVVLDIGAASLDDWNALAALERHRLLGAAPIVLLSWACPTRAEPATKISRHVCVAKPFDARALDDAVAAILAPATVGSTAVPGTVLRSGATQVPAAAASASEPAPAPSVWPLVTAGAGFAAVVGFMIHPIYVLVGLTVMIGAVLRWALEPTDAGVQL